MHQEIKTAQSQSLSNAQRLEELKLLIEEDRYSKALEMAKRYFGHYREWGGHPSHIPLICLMADCFYELGNSRTGDALVLSAHRKYPLNIDLTIEYLHIVRRRYNMLDVLLGADKLLKLSLSYEQYKQVTLLKSRTLCVYRDFDSAKQLIDDLANKSDDQQSSQDLDVLLKYAQLYLADDNLPRALHYLDRILLISPTHSTALRFKAHVLYNDGKEDEACEILRMVAERSESIMLLGQLCQYEINRGAYEPAVKNITRIIEVTPQALSRPDNNLPIYERFNTNRQFQRLVNSLYAEWFCAQQKYSEAMPYFEHGSGFWQRVKTNLDNEHGNSQVGESLQERKVLDVPFVLQAHMTCAPASITSVGRYWGKNYQHDDVVNAICYNGTPAVEERRWLIEEGWYCCEFELQFETIEALLDNDIPVLFTTVEPGSAHLQIIVGYDIGMGVYFLRDPNSPRLNEMLMAGAHSYYASSGPRCTLMLPKEKTALLEGIHLEAKALYDDYYDFSRALDCNDRKAAFQAFAKLREHDQHHRITYSAQRELARFDRDSVGELSALEKLLEKYPQDVNFQNAKVYLLSNVHSHSATLAYLNELHETYGFQYSIESQRVEQLRFDHRQANDIRKTYKKLLRLDSLHASTLYSYAGYLWGEGEKRIAYDIYRLLTCLEDKTEYYAESYFKAARYFHDTDKALNFLRERYRLYHKKSNGPLFSLYYALQALDRDNESMELLQESMDTSPDKGALLLFCAREFLSIGDVEKSEAMLAQAQTYAHPLHLLQMQASLSEFKCERENAIEQWQKLLAYEPLNKKAIDGIMGLFHEMDERESAIKFIDKQLKKVPGNYALLRAKLDYLYDAVNYPEERCEVLQTLIDNHADDAASLEDMALSKMSLYRLDEALNYANEAVKMSPGSAGYHKTLGDVYFARQDLEQARLSYRQAIALSCDLDGVFDALLTCVFDLDAINNELSYICEQLLEQVSFGDGILNYQATAVRWLQASELESFLLMALEQRRDLWQAHIALVRFYREQGDAEKAVHYVNDVIEKFPLLPIVHFDAALLYKTQGEFEKAEKSLAQALIISPKWTKAIQLHVDLLELQGNYEGAIAIIKKALSKDPKNSVFCGFLADLLYKTDNKNEAKKYLFKAVELSPFYSWAWEQLVRWSDNKEDVDGVKSKLQALRDTFPNNQTLLNIQAQVEENLELRVSMLLEYLDRNPNRVSVFQNAFDTLISLKKYEDALALCEKMMEVEHVTSSHILAAKAEVLHYLGRATDAITQMQQVVVKDHNYYSGWRLLVLWFEKQKNIEEMTKALVECQRIYPNDASVLCFVAEKTQTHKPDEVDKVVELLQRAVQIQPDNRYVGLTYIDELLEQESYVKADVAIERLKQFFSDTFVIGRELRSAYEQQLFKNEEKLAYLKALFSTIIEDREVGDGIIRYCWYYISKLDLHEALLAIVLERRKNNEWVSPHWAYYLSDFEIKKSSPEIYLDALLDNSATHLNADINKNDPAENDEYFQRQLEAYISSKEREGVLPPKKYRQHILRLINNDVTNWGAYGQLLINLGEWNNAWEHYNRPDIWPHAQGHMLYRASLAARHAGFWREGENLMLLAYSCDKDNYRDDIEVWHAMDCLLAGKAVNLEPLKWIIVDDLSPISVYVNVLVKALIALDKKDFVNMRQHVSPLLRQAQKKYQPVNEYNVTSSLRKRVRKHIGKSIKGNMLLRMFWVWWLDNHF